MRVWDINPGYLNNRSLLGEHRELHGIVSIITQGKKGYSRHPETIRWIDHLNALSIRHCQLSCEMRLRGFNEKSPVVFVSQGSSHESAWPEEYIDTPAEQYEILRMKYVTKEEGRIMLPRNIQELWSHHKYSMLARDQKQYREIGRLVAVKLIGFNELAGILTAMLRIRPEEGGIRNAVQHMWGHVSSGALTENGEVESWSLARLIREVIQRTIEYKEPYLCASTALGELSVWIKSEPE